MTPHLGLLAACVYPRESIPTKLLTCFIFGRLHALRNDFAVATHYVRKMPGSSQPILAEASDGHQYVVKFANNLIGPNLLFNESMGSELYRVFSLPVPRWEPILLTDSFIDRHPGLWMESPNGRLRPTPGLCFGSRFLGEREKPIFEILPDVKFKRIRNRMSFWLAWVIDVCAEHVDNRQAIFFEYFEGWLEAVFFDHGHLFGGPKADTKKGCFASRYLDSRIYPRISSEELLHIKEVLQALDADMLWKRAEAIPREWRRKEAITAFENCLQRISHPRLVQTVLDTINDALKRETKRQQEYSAGGLEPSFAIQRSRVQSAGWGDSRASNSACS
jgi:hypothetical protein